MRVLVELLVAVEHEGAEEHAEHDAHAQALGRVGRLGEGRLRRLELRDFRLQRVDLLLLQLQFCLCRPQLFARPACATAPCCRDWMVLWTPNQERQ